jgi:UDP-N-acetyl-D-galactosamine dehydrogenase
MMQDDTRTIGVIGLGYVGLPLAVEFGKRRPVVGYDIDRRRVSELRAGVDHTGEVEADELVAASHLTVTDREEELLRCDVFIVTVPTPVRADFSPDLGPLRLASELVGRHLRRGGLVIYESTVYPGCTEEECVPILERTSGLALNEGFFCGYSPERVNPGDRQNRLTKIRKVTSGSCEVAAAVVDSLYSQIITAGTVPVSSIKVAEASKVIENAQRDLNISFVNELALIFDRIGIDTMEVLEAASTKWNFQMFRPGLVGGHCISVDPYYLVHKAERLGYHPEVILSGRRVNNRMASFIATKTIKLMISKGLVVRGARTLIMGVTFKEDCPDVRNSKVVDIATELREFGVEVEFFDPVADVEEVEHDLGVRLLCEIPLGVYDAVVVAVSHSAFRGLDISALKRSDASVVYDVKSMLDRRLVDGRL